MPRFVVQHHIFSDADEHWDLMLEVAGGLRTWSLPHPPDEASRLPMAARRLKDHRLDYLEYEGDVSGDRGRVEIRDRGIYEWLGEPDAVPADTVNRFEFELRGEKTVGRFQLTLASQDGKDLWRLRAIRTPLP
jgi:hypothetical protein